MRARLLKPMHRGQLPALRCRHARVDGLQRLSGRLALPQAGTPSPSCRRPGANPRPWTKISMGTRAHTTPIAPTRRPSSAPRSALRAALRVTGHRSWRSHTTRWPSPGHPPNNFTHTSLTRPDCTDKRNSEQIGPTSRTAHPASCLEIGEWEVPAVAPVEPCLHVPAGMRASGSCGCLSPVRAAGSVDVASVAALAHERPPARRVVGRRAIQS